MKEISIHVGQRIRLYRKMKGLTIETFAGMIHKSKATVSKYENGDISIDIETLFVIARALEVAVNQLIDYTNEEEQAAGDGAAKHPLSKSRYYMYFYDGRRSRIARNVIEVQDGGEENGVFEANMYAYLESMDPMVVLQMIAPTMIVYVILMIGIMIPIYYRLRLTQLLILDDDQIGARMAMHHSIVLTKGSCLQLFLMDLSFWWYHLLIGIAGLIPMASLLPVFAGLDPVFVNLLLTTISCIATLGIYMLGLMKVQTCNAIAYDQLRTAPKTEAPQLPEEEQNG